MSEYKFNGNKYVTNGIQNELSEGLTMFLWYVIEEKKRDEDFEMDYLIIFQLLINEDGRPVVVYKQEQPVEYTKAYYPINVPLTTGTIYIIDDGTHCTMLWSREY